MVLYLGSHALIVQYYSCYHAAKIKAPLELIDSIATSPVKLMHLKVFGCYMHGTLKTWSVHPPQPKPELELRAKGQIISKGVFWCLQFLPKGERKHVE